MSCRSCPLDDAKPVKKRLGSMQEELKNIFPKPTLCKARHLTTWSLKTLHQNAIQRKTFTMNCRGQSKGHPICRGKLLSAHHGGAGRRCYGATCLTWNRSILCELGYFARMFSSSLRSERLQLQTWYRQACMGPPKGLERSSSTYIRQLTDGWGD